VLATTIVAIGLVAGVALPASAAPSRAPAGLVKQATGPASGSEMFEFGTNGCSFVFEQFDLTVETQTGPVTLRVSGCVDSGPRGFTFSGTFVLTARNGATLTGTATGPAGNPPLSFVLTAESGRKQFKRLVGSQFRLFAPNFFGSLSGGALTLL
jgi:hypothetical protein